MPCMALRTILSTKNVQNFRMSPVLPAAKAVLTPARFLIAVRIVLQINSIKTGAGSCAQSYPQKMCRTGQTVFAAQ